MNKKWIVYLTINKVNNKIYIGYHGINDINVNDLYLGNGVIASKPSSYKKSKTPFQYAVNKYGPKNFKRYILRVCDTVEEAKAIEAFLVDENFVKRKDTYNVALGGGDIPNGDTSIEIFQYDFNGNFIKSWKSAVDVSKYFNIDCTSIRAAVKYKKTSCGYLWTEIYTDKIDPKDFHIDIKHDFLYKFDKTGKIISKFKTAKDAAKDAGSEVRLILNAIAGKSKSKGFYYSYDKDFKINPNNYNKIEEVYLYNLDGTFYKKFDSPRECADYFGDVKTSRIYSAIRTGGLYKKYQIFKEPMIAKELEVKNREKKVGQYTLDGKLIKVWPTIQSAFLEYGPGVKKCVKNIQKQTKGFIFKIVS